MVNPVTIVVSLALIMLMMVIAIIGPAAACGIIYACLAPDRWDKSQRGWKGPMGVTLFAFLAWVSYLIYFNPKWIYLMDDVVVDIAKTISPYEMYWVPGIFIFSAIVIIIFHWAQTEAPR